MIPAWLLIPICLAAALVIAYGVLGAFAVIDFYNLNKREIDE